MPGRPACDAEIVRLGRLTVEHPTVAGLAASLVSILEHWTGEIRSAQDASAWMHHGEFAERTEHLAGHLAAIVALADKGRFASSMAVTRTALEHHIIDRLLLLADRYVEIVRPEDPATIDQWEADWAARTEPWTRDVESIERTRNGRALRLVRMGHKVRTAAGEEREQISPYWPALEQYDAFIGHPDAQLHIVQPFDDLDIRVEWASRNQAVYGAFLRWGSLCSNLQLNNLASDAELVQLQAHYAFLSAFTHATKSGYECDRVARPGAPNSAHLFGELALLYVIAVAIAQVDAWSAYVERRPHLLSTLRPEVLSAVNRSGTPLATSGSSLASPRSSTATRRPIGVRGRSCWPDTPPKSGRTISPPTTSATTGTRSNDSRACTPESERRLPASASLPHGAR